ncbi:MAG: RNA polymerase factor sigma-54 [Desulfomonilaceae bacterium]
MALEIKQQLRQTQQLVMTPQLQQAIKLLQYNHLEVIDAVEQELKENPLLEASSFDEPFSEEGESEVRNDLNSLEDLTREPERPDQGDIFDVDWENYLESYGGDYSPAQKDFADRPPIENMVSYQETLFQYLLHQLQLSHIEGEDRKIALEIIGNVDENGYLDVELAELADSLQVPVEDVERILTEVQTFDPRGVAARNFKECLMIQVRALDPPHPLAERILAEVFELFQQGKLDQVARKLKVSLEEVKEAGKVICSVDPKPGRPFISSDTIYVVPDIFVIRTGKDYTVVLNDDGLPRLKISPFYQRELHSNGCSSVAKDYIQEKMRGAMWLIKSIHQRQRTIYKVAQSIIKFQREFFDKGIDYLRPLILKDVADDIEMHESTISRVTTNKYMHTPRGIFELKYFFNSGIGYGADAIASESVKNQIVRIVKNENPKRPASDKQIVEELAKCEIHIARRTVAKYRELMSIAPSSKRRKKF